MTNAKNSLHPAVVELRQLFISRLVAQTPVSVVDVAFGDAHLLAALRVHEIPAVGLEDSETRVAEATERDFDVRLASAEHLPYDDRSFDWGAMRHAAHHLPDPVLGILELARVAKTGVIIAEPWRETAIASQRLAAEWDAFTRVLERRRGDIHHDNIVIASMLEWIGQPNEWVAEFNYYQPVGLRPHEDIELQAEALTPFATADELRERDRLLASARKTGIGIAGTAILVARRA